MSSANSPSFEELTTLASDFVTRQQGLWDHEAWNDFVASVRKRGFDISEEMLSNLGELLEAMKHVYIAAASTESVENSMRAVVRDSVDFIKRQDGVWGHSEWEDFLKTAQQNTLTLSEGTASYLGNVLESIRVFYRLPIRKPVRASTKSASTKSTAVSGASPSAASAVPAQVHLDDSEVAAMPTEDALPVDPQVQERREASPAPDSAAEAAPVEAPPTAAPPVETLATGVRPEEEGPSTGDPTGTSPAPEEAPEGAVAREAVTESPAGDAAPKEARAKEAPAKEVKETRPKDAPSRQPAKKTPRKSQIQRDDLTAIGGIGPVLAKKLNDAGISSYAQLAALTDEDIEHLEKNIIKYSGRITRDDWVGQARRLL